MLSWGCQGDVCSEGAECPGLGWAEGTHGNVEAVDPVGERPSPAEPRGRGEGVVWPEPQKGHQQSQRCGLDTGAARTTPKRGGDGVRGKNGGPNSTSSTRLCQIGAFHWVNRTGNQKAGGPKSCSLWTSAFQGRRRAEWICTASVNGQ